MPTEPKMKKVRIDESLLEQMDWYDIFPRGVWSRQAKANYLIEIGLRNKRGIIKPMYLCAGTRGR